MKNINKYSILILVAVLIASSCSRTKSTFMTRNYRAVNAEFNALYNGGLALEQGKKTLAQDYKDDYFEILPVERIQLSNDIMLPGEFKSPDFERAEEKAVKAIQKHSIYFDGKEHNPQIDEAYMLLGKARYFDSRFIPALEAFNFILSRYATSNSVNQALIWREKTNIRLQNEDVAIKNLKRLFSEANLNEDELADASAMMAQAYINLDSIDKAVHHISMAAEHTRNNELKGRLYFIKGQLYNELNQKDSANHAFEEVIELNRRTNRSYLINAHIEIAKNFDYEKGDKEALLLHLNELAEDRENRPFLDVIYHQKGVYYTNIDSIDASVAAYNRSIKEFKQNNKLQALNYSSLGDIYFDKSEFKKAGDYYDSTLQRLVVNERDYRQIKKKRDNLEDVIRFENIANTNDSILALVEMSESQRLAFFTDYTDKLKQKAIGDSLAASKERDSFRSDEFFKEGKGSQKADGKFYFYNQSSVSMGKIEFKRRWGERTLEDDWRRSKKASGRGSEIAQTQDEGEAAPTIDDNPLFLPETYLSQIPTDEKVIDSIALQRNLAYYQLGLIYQEKFKEYELAIDRLETLLTYNPEERLVVPSKYHLFKIHELLGNAAEKQRYRNDIVTNHADTRYAEIILNPDTLLSLDETSPEYRYNELYRLFEQQKYTEVIEQAEYYINGFTGDEIVPKLELLKATAIGRRDGFAEYKTALNYVALNYPNSDEGKTAQTIYSTTLSKLENFNFEANNDSERWKLIYEFETANSEDALALQEKINEAIKELNYGYLETSLDLYTSNKVLVVVHGLFSREGAKGFAEVLRENKDFKIVKPSIEISSPNYAIVQVHKNLSEYNTKTE